MDRDNDGRNNREPNRRGSSRKTDGYESDGVYYTPSSSSQKRPPTRKNTPPERKPAARQPAPQPKKKIKASKTRYVAFYIITLVVAVIVCLSVFFMVFTSTLNKNPQNGTDTASFQTQPPNPSGNVTAVDETSVIGVLRTINTGSKSLGLLDINSLKTYTFSVDSRTTMQNKYGEAMTFAEFKTGDIVDARYTELGGTLSGMTISTQAWEHKNVTNVKVNAETKTISIGNDTYKYDDDQTISLFNGENYNIADIDSLNVVTLRGMDQNVWYIEISKGIGYVDIINGEGIKDGVIEIDNNMTMPLNEAGTTGEPIKVQSGSRKIIVKGSNIEIFTTTLEVNADESAILDLSQVQVTAGVLTLNISEPDAVVTIDGTVRRASEPQILTYGSYNISVTKEGFKTYESEFEMNEPSLELDIDLEKEIKLTDITVITTPSGADVYIDNAYVGISPVTTPVEEGIRNITVKKTGYLDVNVQTDNYHTEYTIGLREEPVIDPIPTPNNFPMPDTQQGGQDDSQNYVPVIP